MQQHKAKKQLHHACRNNHCSKTVIVPTMYHVQAHHYPATTWPSPHQEETRAMTWAFINLHLLVLACALKCYGLLWP